MRREPRGPKGLADSRGLGGGGVSRFSVLFLAGGPNQPSLQRALGFPVAGLPLESDRTLLAAWLDVIDRRAGDPPSSMHLLCSAASDADWFSAELRRAGRSSAAIDVRLDARAHRGVCGLLADTASDCPLAEWSLVVELNALPPASLDPLFEAAAKPEVAMAVGSSRDERPAGVFLLRNDLLKEVPRLGYLDLKEQFLPQLVARGRRIEAAALSETAVRLTDRRNYLRAIRIWQSTRGAAAADPAIAGSSLVCEGVQMPQDGFVIDSVILPGAAIGRGAVIARSVIGPLMQVPEGSVLVDAVLANPRLGGGRSNFRASAGIPVQETPKDAVPSWSR